MWVKEIAAICVVVILLDVDFKWGLRLVAVVLNLSVLCFSHIIEFNQVMRLICVVSQVCMCPFMMFIR